MEITGNRGKLNFSPVPDRNLNKPTLTPGKICLLQNKDKKNKYLLVVFKGDRVIFEQEQKISLPDFIFNFLLRLIELLFLKVGIGN